MLLTGQYGPTKLSSTHGLRRMARKDRKPDGRRFNGGKRTMPDRSALRVLCKQIGTIISIKHAGP